MEESTKVFLMDVRRNRYDPENRTLELSPIFKWYGGDFEKTSGSVQAFVASRITNDPPTQEQIQRREVKIRYLDYDWSLNDQE